MVSVCIVTKITIITLASTNEVLAQLCFEIVSALSHTATSASVLLIIGVILVIVISRLIHRWLILSNQWRLLRYGLWRGRAWKWWAQRATRSRNGHNSWLRVWIRLIFNLLILWLILILLVLLVSTLVRFPLRRPGLLAILVCGFLLLNQIFLILRHLYFLRGQSLCHITKLGEIALTSDAFRISWLPWAKWHFSPKSHLPWFSKCLHSEVLYFWLKDC
jgi:hypothetical protein